MPQVAAAVAALDPAHVAAALRDGGRVGINVDGHEHELGPDDVTLALQPLAGYQLEREGSHAVALVLELDEELHREGLAREVVHAIQNARKGAGLQVEDRIELVLGGDDELLVAARDHEAYLAEETLAVRSSFDGAEDGTERGHRGPPAADRAARVRQRRLLRQDEREVVEARGAVAGDEARRARRTPGRRPRSSTTVPYGVALTEKMSVTGSPGLPGPAAEPQQRRLAARRSARSA